MSVDKIYMIKLCKELNKYNTKLKSGETMYNNFFLGKLGYVCNMDLCSNYITVYYNENKQKVIVYFDGINDEFAKSNESFDIFSMKQHFDDYTVRAQHTINSVNEKYAEYNKLYLGYCLGGYMINNYISGKHIVAYTYNSYGFQHNKISDKDIKIINYCELFDYVNIFWRFNNNNNIESKIVTTEKFVSKFISDCLFNFNISNMIDYFKKAHFMYLTEETVIEINF